MSIIKQPTLSTGRYRQPTFPYLPFRPPPHPSLLLHLQSTMAGLPAQNSRVVKIPLPSNVDPDWRFKLELCDLNDGRYSDGFHAGAYVGVPAHDREAREMAMTLDMHIRNGSTIQAIPLNSDNSLSQYQYVTRSAVSTVTLFVRVRPRTELAMCSSLGRRSISMTLERRCTS